MDISKSYDFFKPEDCNDRIHIIGCGAIGSTLAENLVRYGLTNITLYDFDTVDTHNISNQLYTSEDIGKLKVEALADYLKKINPEIGQNLKLKREGYTDQRLSGYVFLCVDSIELRKDICEKNQYNQTIKAVFDFRMGLTNAQHFAADWSNRDDIKNLIGGMNFTDEEARAETPVTGCNLTLSVNSTVRLIVSIGVANFINFVKRGREKLKHMILCDAFIPFVDAL